MLEADYSMLGTDFGVLNAKKRGKGSVKGLSELFYFALFHLRAARFLPVLRKVSIFQSGILIPICIRIWNAVFSENFIWLAAATTVSISSSVAL
jgi:hypothetical protein